MSSKFQLKIFITLVFSFNIFAADIIFKGETVYQDIKRSNGINGIEAILVSPVYKYETRMEVSTDPRNELVCKHTPNKLAHEWESFFTNTTHQRGTLLQRLITGIDNLQSAEKALQIGIFGTKPDNWEVFKQRINSMDQFVEQGIYHKVVIENGFTNCHRLGYCSIDDCTLETKTDPIFSPKTTKTKDHDISHTFQLIFGENAYLLNNESELHVLYYDGTIFSMKEDETYYKYNIKTEPGAKITKIYFYPAERMKVTPDINNWPAILIYQNNLLTLNIKDTTLSFNTDKDAATFAYIEIFRERTGPDDKILAQEFPLQFNPEGSASIIINGSDTEDKTFYPGLYYQARIYIRKVGSSLFNNEWSAYVYSNRVTF